MSERRQRYPIGQQDFAGIREGGWVYVDKTGVIYELINDAKYVFLSRPRRFGKSLLLSTIRYYFEGRKDLFEGLKISYLEKDWKKHPVLFLSFVSLDASSPAGLNSILESQLREWEEVYAIDSKSLEYAQRFGNVIKAAYEKSGEKVVVLIDEYDQVLLNSIEDKKLYETNRDILKSVYSNLKEMDGYIRFGMLTGVSRFGNTTIFSGLNNLQDISFMEEYSSICGFTESEIKDFLWPGVELLAQKEVTDAEGALKLLKEEYDGYHFSEDLTDIYNPFSVLNCLSQKKILNFWFKSGIPTFLAKKLEESEGYFNDIFNAEKDSYYLSSIDSAFYSPVALLFQTGYLTIKSYKRKEDIYRLGIPNREVERSLLYFLLGYYSKRDYDDSLKILREMVKNLMEGDADMFMKRLQTVLAPISYELSGKFNELDFERILFIIFHLLGLHVHCELRTSSGRIDLTIETGKFVYIIELKLDQSAQVALDQINNKDYSLPWKTAGRQVIKIGASFSSEERNLVEWLIINDNE